MAQVTAEKPDVKEPVKDAAESGNTDSESGPQTAAAASAATDKPPKKKPGRPKGSKNKAKGSAEPSKPRESTARKQLTRKVDGFLKSPAFVFEAVGDDWPAKHVDNAATPLAESIVLYCEKNPIFQARLEAFFEGGATAGLILASAMYVLPLGMYFGVIPAPERVRVMLNVPEKPGTIRVETPVPGSWEGVPLPLKEQIEAEAREAGFTLDDGSADIEGFMATINQAFQTAREGGVENE